MGFSSKKRLCTISHGGNKADTRRTSSGDAARAYRGQPFSSKREPNSKLFGGHMPQSGQLPQKLTIYTKHLAKSSTPLSAPLSKIGRIGRIVSSILLISVCSIAQTSNTSVVCAWRLSSRGGCEGLSWPLS